MVLAVVLVLVVVLVLKNPDRFAIRLTEQISCRTSVSLRSRNPMHRGRARRRGRGRFQISEFGLRDALSRAVGTRSCAIRGGTSRRHFSLLPRKSAHGLRDVSIFKIHWMSEPGSRGSASLPPVMADHFPYRIRAQSARKQSLEHSC